MKDMNYAPVCGIFCGNCVYLNKDCQGCGYEQGKPFWTGMMPAKICPLFNCCRNNQNLEHCGLCDDFPCKTFLELRDPNLSDDEFKHSITLRQNELKRRTKIGTSTWLKEKATI